MFQPIRKQSVTDAVYAQLRDQILTGQLSAGAQLPAERLLSEQLQAGRSAIREALGRLEQAKLVETQHGGGTRVLDFRRTGGLNLLTTLLMDPDGRLDVRVARSVIEMRSVLGPEIARLAARRGPAALPDELERSLAAMVDAGGDVIALQPLALAYWGALVTGSGNIAYRLAFNTMRETYQLFMPHLAPMLAEELTALERYRRLTDAVAAHDETQAVEAARELINAGATRMLDMLYALDPTLREEG